MASGNQPEITALYRYPVKGLSAQKLEKIAVAAGEAVTFDRAWAIEKGSGKFDPEAPEHLPKINFAMLMRDGKLAALDARFDADEQSLTILRDGRQVVSARLSERLGRQILEQFFSAFLDAGPGAMPRIVESPGHHFTDMAEKLLSVINLASVRELERVVGRPVDPLRFRGNIYVDGLEPWAEFGWLGRQLAVSGTALFEVRERIGRCAATDVEPGSGERDMNIVRTLMNAFGHTDMGVYVAATADGAIATGDVLTLKG